MMKNYYLIVLMVFSGLLLTKATDPNKESLLGTWITQDKEAYVTIYKQNDLFYGKISWMKSPVENGHPKLDTKNPDPSKRNQPMMGSVILRDFKYAGEKVWTDGKIYEPPTGKDYSCKMKLVDNNTLDVRGYVGISLFGESETWKRIK
jgi:uncharacterized protein (DUF2147 family)